MRHKFSVAGVFLLMGLYIISRYIYFNPTPSETIGYYFVYHPLNYNVGDLVLVCVKDRNSMFILYELGLPYSDENGCKLPLLLKRIAAQSRDTIEITSRGILINEKLKPHTKAIYEYENLILNGLPIGTHYQLTSEQYFLLGQGDRSYDSRYFGIVPVDALRYKAILIWRGKLWS